MNIVLDSNAALEVVLSRPRAKVFAEAIGTAGKTLTSDLYKVETANAVWKYCRAGYIPAALCTQLLELTASLIDEYVDIAENNFEALHEAMRLEHTVYDMLYLTLARRTGSALVTLDKRLAALAEQEKITVIK